MSMAILFPEVSHGRGELRKRLTLGLAAAVAMAVLTGASAITSGTISAGPDKAPVNWSARNVVVDYKTRQTLMHLNGDVKISQGEMSVAADAAEATMLDAKNSHWVFSGNVHVRAEREGDLRADHATVEITNSALASARVTGSPSQFEQTRSQNGNLAKGHSSTVDYDVMAGTVKLTGDAFLSLSDGQNVMKAPSITYNVRDRQIEGAGDSATGERGHMTLTPKSSHDANAGTGKP
jgi:lipopolysaccharide transport protein LptA